MPFVPVPNTAQFNIRYTVNGELAENTLYFSRANGWGAGDLTVGAAYLRDWFVTNIRSQLGAQAIFKEVYGVDLSSQNGPTSTVSVTNDPGGPIVGDMMPGSVSLCVTFRTAKRGRSFRGRNYISGFTEGQVAGNSFAVTAPNNIATAYDLLVAADMNGSRF